MASESQADRCPLPTGQPPAKPGRPGPDRPDQADQQGQHRDRRLVAGMRPDCATIETHMLTCWKYRSAERSKSSMCSACASSRSPGCQMPHQSLGTPPRPLPDYLPSLMRQPSLSVLATAKTVSAAYSKLPGTRSSSPPRPSRCRTTSSPPGSNSTSRAPCAPLPRARRCKTCTPSPRT